jgi:hypothetical protein
MTVVCTECSWTAVSDMPNELRSMIYKSAADILRVGYMGQTFKNLDRQVNINLNMSSAFVPSFEKKTLYKCHWVIRGYFINYGS